MNYISSLWGRLLRTRLASSSHPEGFPQARSVEPSRSREGGPVTGGSGSHGRQADPASPFIHYVVLLTLHTWSPQTLASLKVNLMFYLNHNKNQWLKIDQGRYTENWHVCFWGKPSLTNILIFMWKTKDFSWRRPSLRPCFSIYLYCFPQPFGYSYLRIKTHNSAYLNDFSHLKWFKISKELYIHSEK